LGLDEEVLAFGWPDPHARELRTRGGVPRTISSTRTWVRDKITFPAQSLQLRTIIGNNTANWINTETLAASVLLGPFTFTYPTVYIAHRPITTVLGYLDTNSSSYYYRYSTGIGSAGVIGVASTDVFSAVPEARNTERGLDYARKVANGQFDPGLFAGEIPSQYPAVYDFNDILDPVPAESFFNAKYDDCWDQQTHCATITDNSYRPRLAMPKQVWESMFPKAKNCAYLIVPDPPVALEVAAEPEIGLDFKDFPALLTQETPSYQTNSLARPRFTAHHGQPEPTASPRNPPGKSDGVGPDDGPSGRWRRPKDISDRRGSGTVWRIGRNRHPDREAGDRSAGSGGNGNSFGEDQKGKGVKGAPLPTRTVAGGREGYGKSSVRSEGSAVFGGISAWWWIFFLVASFSY
jgi:hypothetical protein